MIELFTAPATYPFITIHHTIEFDATGHIKNPAPLSIVATMDVDVIPDATNETLYDLFSALEVQPLMEGFDDYETAVYISINKECNEIARSSRRGAGNIVIGSSEALAPLNREMFCNTCINGRVIVNEDLPNDEVVIIYNGISHELEAVDAPFAFDGKHLRLLPHWTQYVRRLSVV